MKLIYTETNNEFLIVVENHKDMRMLTLNLTKYHRIDD